MSRRRIGPKPGRENCKIEAERWGIPYPIVCIRCNGKSCPFWRKG